MKRQHIILLIDVSISMFSSLHRAVPSLNNFINNLKLNSDYDETYLSLITFSEKINYIYRAEYITHVNTVKNDDIYCCGITRLYDTIAQVLFDWRDDVCERNVLFIITDDADTGSMIFSKAKVGEICSDYEKTGIWEIYYCGTDISHLDVQRKIKYRPEDITELFDMLNI